MKIINRYVLKEHVGPFVFALSALTSILLLQYIARRFGDLVGKGLSWQVIAEFLLLSVPLTLALTVPMAVLVAVLYAFSRLASENEITALRAGGVSSRSLLIPTLTAGALLAIGMVWFNDQVLSGANHELQTLQTAIFRTKPTFALKPQVINAVKEGQLYLRAGQISQDEAGRMRDVTIYDLSDASRRRTIYADSGSLTFALNRKDLILHLFHGMMMSEPTNAPEQLDRIYYRRDDLKVRDVANAFQNADADTVSKGEREMSVCELQKQYELKDVAEQRAFMDSVDVAFRARQSNAVLKSAPKPKEQPVVRPAGLGAWYCRFTAKYLHVREARADVPPRQDTTRRAHPALPTQGAQIVPGKKVDTVTVLVGAQYVRVPRDKIPPGARWPGTNALANPNDIAAAAGKPPVTTTVVSAPVAIPAQTPAVSPAAGSAAAAMTTPPNTIAVGGGVATMTETAIEIEDAARRLGDARHWRNVYIVEIQKKFSLAAACFVLALVGAPIALRFPRGGVGLVMGVGLTVFAIYYVALVGGESLADKNIISPYLAMWADNIIFFLIGLAFAARMGHERVTSRGGGFGEMVDKTRAWFGRIRGRGAVE